VECRSDEVAFRNSHKDSSENGTTDNAAENGLEENGILNLAKCRLLHPGLAIEDLPDDVAVLILCNPGFSLIAVVSVERVH